MWELDAVAVVISCQKGVRLTYYQPNELGRSALLPSEEMETEISNGSVPLSRNQNDNGTEVCTYSASNGTGGGRDRLKKGDVRDGRIFLGSREEERKSAAAGKI